MRIGVDNFYTQLATNNFMFKTPDAPIGDALLRPFNMLYAQAKAKGIEMMTLDLVTDWDSMDAFIFMDLPSPGPLFDRVLASGKPRYLVIWENVMVRPSNWEPLTHAVFDKVFTWHDELAGHGDYVKINYAHLFPPTIGYAHTEKKKLCTLIACNKLSPSLLSLYGARINSIRWFEQNKPTDFDLYGQGWDQALFPSYRGPVAAKRPTLASYRFALAFENARIPGYITEKIFDCFFAGTVPLYLGAPNVEDHIPAECFIDVTKFDSWPEIHRFMSTMTPEAYQAKLDAITRYLKSAQSYEFTAQRFVDTILLNLPRGT
jgi:alpha(1,3/1,4) fucosyltransferase